MPQEQNSAERLEAAISALGRGEPYDQVAASLPAELRPRLAAAARLMQVRGSVGASGPRPTFALGLEEQLRTDLRLGRAQSVPRASRVAVRNLLAVTVAAVLLLYLGVSRSGPGAPLYPMRQALDEARSTLHLSHQARSLAFLDLGWQRIDILGRLIGRHESDPMVLEPLAAGVADAFSAALDSAQRSGDDMLARRIVSQANLAEAEIARLGTSGDPVAARVVSDLLDRLGNIVSDDKFVLGDGPRYGPAADVTDEPPELATVAPPTSAAGEVTPTVSTAGETVVPTPSSLPQTTSVAPDPATSTPLPPLSPTPIDVATATPEPPPTVEYPPTREKDEPTATKTPAPPTATPDVNAPSPTSTEDPRTPTRDTHPVTTTPGTPIVPTATPLGATVAPDLTPIVPPTEGPTQGPGDRQATPQPPAP